MKLFKKSITTLAASLLLVGCGGGDSTPKKGTATTYEEFEAKVATLSPYTEHPYVSANVKYVVSTPEGGSKQNYEFIWNSGSKAWECEETYVDTYVQQAINSPIQQINGYVIDNHQKGKDEQCYVDPLSYVVSETKEGTGQKDTYTYIWDEYGLMVYAEQYTTFQGQSGKRSITITYVKPSQSGSNTSGGTSGDNEFGTGTQITAAEFRTITNALTHNYNYCVMHQKVVNDGSTTENDITYSYSEGSWVRQSGEEFAASLNDCTVEGFVGEYQEGQSAPNTSLTCYKDPLTAIGTYGSYVYKMAYDSTTGLPVKFVGDFSGAIVTLTFAFSTVA